MPQMVMEVDKSSGNYESIFLYTLNASFNGISGGITESEIRLFIPKWFLIYMGDIGEPIKEMRTEITEEGTTYIFDFGEITDLGVAVRIGFGAQFIAEAMPLEEIKLVPELWVNGEAILATSSESVQLVVVPRFELTREIALPKSGPAPGGAVFYKVTLENFGDLGASIENVVINCESDSLITLDSEFIIEGKDASSKFPDITKDGVLGRIENNAVVFELEQYQGQRYIFYYRGVIADNVLVGTEIDTIARWSINGIEQVQDVNAITLQAPTSNASVTLYGPDYTLSERLFCYEIYMENTGNQVISDISFVVDLAQDILYQTFTTGTFYFAAIEQEIEADYEITFTTNLGKSGSFGIFKTNINSQLQLSDFIDAGDNITTITWNLATLGVGIKEQQCPHIKGVTKSGLLTGKVMISSFEANWLEDGTIVNRVFTKNSVIQDICVLIPTFEQSVAGTPIRPNEVIRYTIGGYALQSRLNNPLFALLMPKELEYAGDATLFVDRHFDETTIPIIPEVIIVENFNEKGDTLVKFDFRDEYAFEFSQKSIVKIGFNAIVKAEAKGVIESRAVMNVSTSVGEISEGVNYYKDVDGISQDPNVSIYYARATNISNKILLFLSIKSQKLVKGFLDVDYLDQSTNGNTLEGSSVSYKIILENTGNADIDSLEIVDILPYVGDTGVIEEFTKRGSEFNVYNITEVSAFIVEREVSVIPQIFYTMSEDPVRFGNNFNIIGTVDDWNEIPPEDITKVRGFKVKIDEVIYSQETVTIIVNCTVPVGLVEDMQAWNSFAADLSYTNYAGELKHLLAVEPEKVGVTIRENDPALGKIEGIAWFDTSGDGLYEIGETGENDVGVVLYDNEGTPLRATFTTFDANGNSGYYTFPNIEQGSYYVRFFIDATTQQFSPMRLDVESGSKANANTGLTPLLQVEAGESLIVNVGVMVRDKKQIEALLKVNRSANSMLRNVIYDQMLISMKYEDTKELIENQR